LKSSPVKINKNIQQLEGFSCLFKLINAKKRCAAPPPPRSTNNSFAVSISENNDI
jgi:hypothetical protein